MAQVNVVIQTAFLGDLILSIPVLRRIKHLFPNEKLAVVCKKSLGDFLLQENLADMVFEVEKSNRASYKNVQQKLNTFDLNHVFCIHRSLRSLLFASGLNARKKIGYSSVAGFWLFDDVVEYDKKYPDVIRQFRILEPIDSEVRREFLKDGFESLNDIHSPVPDFFSFEISPKASFSKRIAIFPGSVWATKRWTEDGFIKVAEMLTAKGFSVDFMGGPDEMEICERIAAAVPGTQVLAGKYSIAETIKSIPNYGLVIANDSAPAHMAVYKGVPVVTVFGPTTLDLGFRPWSNNSRVVQNTTMDCRPCGAHGHDKCPLGHHECMKSVSAVQVFAAVQELI